MAETSPKCDAQLTVRMDKGLLASIEREAQERHEGDNAPVVRRALRLYFSHERGTGHVARDLGRIVRGELRKFFGDSSARIQR